MVNCSTFGIKVKVSNILHGSVGCGVISGRTFGAGEIVKYYYGTEVYSNMMSQKLVRKTHVDSFRSVTANDLSTWEFKVLKTFLDRAEKE